jgi:hypothetical protein
MLDPKSFALTGATETEGTVGRTIIEALIAGETDPARLAGLASSRIKASPATLTEALRGRITKHHRFLLRLHLEQIDTLDRAIAEIEANVYRERQALTQGGRGGPRSLSPLDPGADQHPWHRRVGRPRATGRDRRRHGPLPDSGASDLVGRVVPEERRERRQAPVEPDAQRRRG